MAHSRKKACAGQEKTSIPGRAAATWGQVKIPLCPANTRTGKTPEKRDFTRAGRQAQVAPAIFKGAILQVPLDQTKKFMPLRPEQIQTLMWAALGVLILVLIYYLSPILTPFLAGAIFAYILNPARAGTAGWPAWRSAG